MMKVVEVPFVGTYSVYFDERFNSASDEELINMAIDASSNLRMILEDEELPDGVTDIEVGGWEAMKELVRGNCLNFDTNTAEVGNWEE